MQSIDVRAELASRFGRWPGFDGRRGFLRCVRWFGLGGVLLVCFLFVLPPGSAGASRVVPIGGSSGVEPARIGPFALLAGSGRLRVRNGRPTGGERRGADSGGRGPSGLAAPDLSALLEFPFNKHFGSGVSGPPPPCSPGTNIVNQTPPHISGSPSDGATLATTHGDWGSCGNVAMTYYNYSVAA